MFRTLLTTIALLSLSLPALADSKIAVQKNVVLIVADDLGLMLGCYADASGKTPNLDRLAREGTRFTRAHCTTASCSASRSVMLTGLYNHATAHYGHEHGYNHFRTYETVRSLPVMLAEAGYRTCSIGKYHLAPESVYRFETYGNDGVNDSPRRNPGQSEGRCAWPRMPADSWPSPIRGRSFFTFARTSPIGPVAVLATRSRSPESRLWSTTRPR